MVKRILCKVVGHDPVRVTRAPGGRRYYSHPRGERVGCHRCRVVLPESG